MSAWWAILLCGGSSERMGLHRNKTLLTLAGVPVLLRAAHALAPHVQGLAVVIRPADLPEAERLLQGESLPCEVRITSGGQTRQASVHAGLDALPEGCTHVLIHDAARCMVDADTIRRVQEAALSRGAAAAALPVTDTLRHAGSESTAGDLVDRNGLWAMQTPQGFELPLIRKAHEAALQTGYEATDDIALVQHMGLPAQLTMGNRNNIKLTTPEDLTMAEALLRPHPPRLRIGHGMDVHRLVPDRKLILCGVEIPHTTGLLGHSDADVALHALMDALLGACALGDIGQHFPDTDAAYQGISSILLLERVGALLREKGFSIVNVDVTIAAQRPKLMPYIPEMRMNIAKALSLDAEAVSVKATTTEHLGFEGREEGISAQAVALVAEAV